MRRIIGIFLIIIALLIIVTLVFTVAFLFWDSKNDWITSSIPGFFIFILLATFLLKYGKKLTTKKMIFNQEELTIEHFNFSVKIEKKEFFAMQNTQLKKSTALISMAIIGSLMIYSIFGYFFFDSFQSDKFPMMQLTFAIMCPLIIFYTIYKSRRAYEQHEQFHQNIEYVFTKEEIWVKGETFESKSQWSNITKYLEMKNWFLLNTTKFTGYLIPKRAFKNEEEENQFRVLLELSIGNLVS